MDYLLVVLLVILLDRLFVVGHELYDGLLLGDIDRLHEVARENVGLNDGLYDGDCVGHCDAGNLVAAGSIDGSIEGLDGELVGLFVTVVGGINCVIEGLIDGSGDGLNEDVRLFRFIIAIFYNSHKL